jgi:hypothetical protein
MASEQRTSALVYGASVFLSAFLLFQIQPMTGKMLLPWFGGSAGVWTTCLLFYQSVLLLGYAWAHWISRWRGMRQWIAHALLLLLSIALLPVAPAERWKPVAGSDPVLGILAALGATVGLPYFLLAATGPLLQTWYAREKGGSFPWPLYALSNAGSLLGLLTYPLLAEPWLTTHDQARVWSGAYVFLAIMSLISARRALRFPDRPAEMPETGSTADRFLWFALPMGTSALLLAATTHITANIAPVPLLWIIPLSAYLVSLILCFAGPRWYSRAVWIPLGVAGMIVLPLSNSQPPQQGIVEAVASVFAIFMVSHGELARRKPASNATLFYLVTAAGGAAGGVAIAVVAPAVLNAEYDLALVVFVIALMLTTLIPREPVIEGARPRVRPQAHVTVLTLLLVPLILFLGIRAVNPTGFEPWLNRETDTCALAMGFAGALYLLWRGGPAKARRLAAGAMLACVLATGLQDWQDFARFLSGTRLLRRNFYGSLKVYQTDGFAAGPLRTLANGVIVHGAQIQTAQLRGTPITYYGRGTGVARALDGLHVGDGLYVGAIGLGTGTIAAFGKPGDRFRFYEINPLDAEIAAKEFTYLSDSPAHVIVVMGDARLSLEREPSQQFDLLVLDAFSGDSIPVHLLTREAFGLYWRHLKPDGVLAVHVSNRFIDLAPVALFGGLESGKLVRRIRSDGDPARFIQDSEWVLISSRANFFERPELALPLDTIEPPPGFRMWTDDYSNLIHLVR